MSRGRGKQKVKSVVVTAVPSIVCRLCKVVVPLADGIVDTKLPGPVNKLNGTSVAGIGVCRSCYEPLERLML